ncbi:MAG: hypothetical protein NC231_02895 [Bacillus sp. (in: Bacteria)]|nr:hypothetical protein [Bacillus sp. (in: firmicutes)]MCM1426020.1 hypothetical protein [Eubacterium sp.]
MSTYAAKRQIKNYIDIHSHILYGIDDGAKDMETSKKMLGLAAADGITAIILTPHNKPGHHDTSQQAAERVEKLRAWLTKENIDIKLYIGNELYYRSELVWEIEDARAYTLAGSRYVLVEFSPLDDYDYIRNGLNAILMGGYYPVLAHAERYQNLCAKKGGIADLVEMGCYIQVNAGSIMGKFGFGAKQFTKKLLKHRQVHFVATDAHDTGNRAPYLADCADYVGRRYGEDYSRQLFYDNPERVLQDKEIAAFY